MTPTAEQLSYASKLSLKKPGGPDTGKIAEWEALNQLWDLWISQWSNFYSDWRSSDEEKEIALGRKIRKKGKIDGLRPLEMNRAVEDALRELALKRPPVPHPPPPPNEAVFSAEMMSLRRKRGRIASKRLEEVLSQESLRRKAEDEMAISKATLTAAKARVLGKPHRSDFFLIYCSCAFFLWYTEL